MHNNIFYHNFTPFRYTLSTWIVCHRHRNHHYSALYHTIVFIFVSVPSNFVKLLLHFSGFFFYFGSRVCAMSFACVQCTCFFIIWTTFFGSHTKPKWKVVYKSASLLSVFFMNRDKFDRGHELNKMSWFCCVAMSYTMQKCGTEQHVKTNFHKIACFHEILSAKWCSFVPCKQ